MQGRDYRSVKIGQSFLIVATKRIRKSRKLHLPASGIIRLIDFDSKIDLETSDHIFAQRFFIIYPSFLNNIASSDYNPS
jgi:hypothetical protein